MRSLFLLAFLLLAGSAHATEIRVLTAGAFKTALLAIADGFAKQTGHQLVVENDTAGGVAQRIARGDAFDVAVLTPATASPLVNGGKLAGVRPVASVGIGVAVKTGAPAPDISSVPAFTDALRRAGAIALVDPASGGSSGIYLLGLFDRLGIAAELRPKLILVQGGLAAEQIVHGKADMALQQQSELVAVPGVTLVGALPEEIQNRTVYVAGLNPAAGEAAQALLAALTGPDARPLLAEKGLTPP